MAPVFFIENKDSKKYIIENIDTKKVFTIPEVLFKLIVIFFGLTNFPAMFQIMMKFFRT